MLADFRKSQSDASSSPPAARRRQADARRSFMKNLRSGVHSLLDRFESRRKEMAEDLHELNREFRAASESFRRDSSSLRTRERLSQEPTSAVPRDAP